MRNKPLAIAGGIGTASVLIWVLIVVPQLINTNEIFELASQNVGEIQFAEKIGMELSEPIKMMFVWTTNVIEENGDEIIFHTVYNYKDILTDESLWITEFDESVNKFTREYTDKEGYFMFPNNLKQQDYDVYDIGGTVLHYNFIGVDEIDGLTVYKFSGQTTFDVSHIYPDFSEQIFEDYSAINYVEPVTGLEVASTEKFTDYTMINGEKVIILDAWDEPTSFSKHVLIQKAKGLKTLYEFYEFVIPTTLIIFTIVTCLLLLLYSKTKKSQEKLEQLQLTDKQKDEFVTMLGHEIKNPLTPIFFLCDLLLREKDGTLNNKQRERIENIKKNTHQLNDLLSDLSEIKKIDLNQLSISKTEVDLREYLENVLEDVTQFSGYKKIEFCLKLENSWKIKCDQKRISQVISNLVKNSIDFVPTVNAKITISAKQDPKGTIISVEDNGVGISSTDSDIIFEKFKQLDNSSNIKHKGTGLGLSICKGIVEAHGGTIWFDKDHTDGAKFHFLIPKD